MMYINPVVVGVLITLGTELLLAIVLGVQSSSRPQGPTFTTRVTPDELEEIMDTLSRIKEKHYEDKDDTGE